MKSWTTVFPEGDFRFHLTLRRGEPGAFFAGQDPTGRILEERRRWLEEDRERHAALEPEGVPLLAEFAELAVGWAGTPPSRAAAPLDVVEMGKRLEPDLLLLAREPGDTYRLRGGALCFPTGWALREKLGATLEEIHQPVPGLNEALAVPVQQFLGRMKPGIAYLRDNWGLAATDELNLHPERGLPAPRRPVNLAGLWLRVEHQALVALPRSGGIAFGIRISLVRLDGVVGTPLAADLRRALATMPEPLAAYKRLLEVREDLLERLA
ncbi:MAG: DUF3445 domain-containing protein [Verrucomicrobia bacterium]|nr:DUF3445 domain-containing protein [Verrucomicrobiota bacterium]